MQNIKYLDILPPQKLHCFCRYTSQLQINDWVRFWVVTICSQVDDLLLVYISLARNYFSFTYHWHYFGTNLWLFLQLFESTLEILLHNFLLPCTNCCLLPKYFSIIKVQSLSIIVLKICVLNLFWIKEDLIIKCFVVLSSTHISEKYSSGWLTLSLALKPYWYLCNISQASANTYTSKNI